MTSNFGMLWLAGVGLLAITVGSTGAKGAVTIDAKVFKNQGSPSTTVTTAAFSTTAANELLLAFVSSDGNGSPNTTVTKVVGAGVVWSLVQRTNVQLGTAEIWWAFAPTTLSGVTVTATLSQSVDSSLTVMSFNGVDTSASGLGAIGAKGTGNAGSGAPTATLVSTRAGSIVLGVGNDWDNGINRTPGAGQTIVHSYIPPAQDTYWVQMQNSATSASGISVTINDTAPTGDRYNLSTVEVLPPSGTVGTTFTVTGTISPAANGNGASVVLSQNGTTVATVTADSTGTYNFFNIANGTYTVTPSKTGFTFNPTSQPAVVNGSNTTVQAFTATATTFTVTGTISPATNGNGASVVLSQNGTTVATVTANSTGTYNFLNIANGSYTVTPNKAGFTFNPASQPAVVNGSNTTVQAFTATAPTFTVTGTISPAANGSGASVVLSQNGATVATVTADSTGTYNFFNVANGTFTVTPSKSGFTFNPTSQPAVVNGSNTTVQAFTATAVPTWTISGAITPASSGAGATVTLTSGGTTVGSTVADSTGAFNFPNLANGTYVVTPTEAGFTFNPANQTAVVSGANVTLRQPFTAVGAPPNLLFPDLRDIIPTGKISIVGTGTSRVFQYTHDTEDAGPGPLVIQPVLNPASGNYQGTQFIYSQNSSGVWSLSQQLPVAGVFIFDSDHGHFHFPFVTYGLYTVGANGGPGTPVVTSGKISFCINDSFIFDSTIPNAGALGNLGSCSDPTSLRGLDIGAVDEYDQTDPGQSIPIPNLPDGTYWLKALVDPNNFLFETDKTNNETDVELTITGSSVQVIKTVIPVLNAPPAITQTSPSGGATISGTVQLTASTATTSGVQFLIDGQAFGAVQTVAPYNLAWDTTTVSNGKHWLAAQTTDSTGIIGTSPVVLVTVSNTTNTPPSAQLTSPAGGSILSSTVTLFATVGGSLPITSVTFFVDFAPIGTLTAPPYMLAWDSTTVADGQHTLSVSATDSGGNVGNSTPVTVQVNNSHPANLIVKDATVSVDGPGVLTTPVFSTTAVSDLLVAFVSYDGPSNGGQTATVSGAGLTWTLLMRSNTQLGTAEIWSGRVDGTTLTNASVSASPGTGGSFHGSLTVIAFTNAAGTSVVGRTGAPSGAPDIPLPGVIAGDWVFAVGNDWDNAIARTPVSGQVLVHQKVDTVVGDTYWVQSTTAPSTANGVVDIHDTAPTGDQWNYAAVEIVATHQ